MLCQLRLQSLGRYTRRTLLLRQFPSLLPYHINQDKSRDDRDKQQGKDSARCNATCRAMGNKEECVANEMPDHRDDIHRYRPFFVVKVPDSARNRGYPGNEIRQGGRDVCLSALAHETDDRQEQTQSANEKRETNPKDDCNGAFAKWWRRRQRHLNRPF